VRGEKTGNLIVTITPTDNVTTTEMTPHVPITLEVIAKDLLECYRLFNHFQDIMCALDASGCTIIRQISTGSGLLLLYSPLNTEGCMSAHNGQPYR
jgi:hypothetical protein